MSARPPHLNRVVPIPMKVRMNENSVRLRLRRSDVEQLRNTGSVSTATGSPGGRVLTYRLSSGTGGETAVAFVADMIETLVPVAAGEESCRGKRVGIYGVIGAIEILVERTSGDPRRHRRTAGIVSQSSRHAFGRSETRVVAAWFLMPINRFGGRRRRMRARP